MSDSVQKVEKNIFEDIKHIEENGKEYWYARELMGVLGYETWESFKIVIGKAQTSLKNIYPQVENHFREVTKMIRIGTGTPTQAQRPITDYRLSRYACYLIAQNGSPLKKEIALAQSYFAIQTRKQEIQDSQKKAIERISAREKLKKTEKKFSGVLSSKGLKSYDIAEIRSIGDEALFNKSTQELKSKLGIKTGALADHLPTITIKAKDLATEITTFTTLSNNLTNKDRIKKEHIDNNKAVRKLLNEKGIYPENLPAEIDIKKLEKRLNEVEMSKKNTDDFLTLDELIIDLTGLNDKEEIARTAKVIKNHPGNLTLKIIYGTPIKRKLLTRKVALSKELIDGLRKYIVLSE